MWRDMTWRVWGGGFGDGSWKFLYMNLEYVVVNEDEDSKRGGMVGVMNEWVKKHEVLSLQVSWYEEKEW